MTVTDAPTEPTGSAPIRLGGRAAQLARGELGSRPDRGGVVGAARDVGLVGAAAPGGRVRPRAQPGGCDGRRADHPRLRRARCAGRDGDRAGGADDRHPRHPGADRPVPPRHRHRQEVVVPAVQRARRRSDLAGLGTRAERDGDEWIVNGQKVWTSGGHWADLGMLLARTNPTAPKHQGITWFAFDMHQPGADVRTLREMTGGAMFSEVFFTDAVVSDADRIGDVNNGWQVANTTLFHERSGMGAGGGASGPAPARWRGPGTVAGDLDKRAGDFVRPAEDEAGAVGDGTQPPRRPPKRLHRARPRDRAGPGPRRSARAWSSPTSSASAAAEHRAPQGGPRPGRRHPGSAELLEAPDGPHPAAQPRPRAAAPRRPRDAARLRRRAARRRSTTCPGGRSPIG